MKADKIKKFMELAGQQVAENFETGDSKKRELGAQLLLSEVLEYVIKGLGVIPEYRGVKIEDANALDYKSTNEPDKLEMLDGLADVAYTMYWNSSAFAIPLEEGFELVCDNNLEKFIKLDDEQERSIELPKDAWHCNKNVDWPEEVTKVEVIQVENEWFAVGKDVSGKVRKPSSYESVDLSPLI